MTREPKVVMGVRIPASPTSGAIYGRGRSQQCIFKLTQRTERTMSILSSWRRPLAISMAVALVVVTLALPAIAAQRSGNPGPFPDGCNIYGSSFVDGNPPNDRIVFASTSEEANCARLQVKIRYKTTSGSLITVSKPWVNNSYASAGPYKAYPYSYPVYSDHNGDNNLSGTTYGFRVNW